MPRDRILAIVQAGGAGSRMDVLTRERAKPALPFAGIYQLIDFPLSNLAHSGITDVWLSVSFQGSTLEEQVANGRPWDLDRNRGGLRLLMPQEGTGSTDEEGFARGNADELYRLRDQIRAEDPDVVVVMSADHVYRFDFRDAIATHRELDADCTVVTTHLPLEEAADHAVVEVDADRRVTGFQYKPDEPAPPSSRPRSSSTGRRRWSPRSRSCTASSRPTARPATAVSGTSGTTCSPGWSSAATSSPIPCPATGATSASRTSTSPPTATCSWTTSASSTTRTGPSSTHLPPRVPARVLDGGSVVDSLLSPGCRVAGTVVRSVLGPGVVVEPGATVRDSVVFADNLVRAGATVDWSVIDRNCTIESDSTVGSPAEENGEQDDDAIVLVGRAPGWSPE